MGVLTTTNVGKLVADLNKLYQPKGKCSLVTNGATMQLLVNRLETYTRQVQDEATLQGLQFDTNVAQWATDMANWRQRLGAYQQELIDTKKPDGVATCTELYDGLVGPLLDGNFASAKSTAGIANPAVPTVPDVATPYMLGNQVIVYREFQAENFAALIEYMKNEAKALAKAAGRVARRAAPNILMIGVGVAIAALAIGRASEQIGKARSKK